MRWQLQALHDATGVMPEQLANAPKCPEGLFYVWGWFCEMFTGEKLTFSEIQAWSNLTRRALSVYEVDLIKSIERVYWELKANG